MDCVWWECEENITKNLHRPCEFCRLYESYAIAAKPLISCYTLENKCCISSNLMHPSSAFISVICDEKERSLVWHYVYDGGAAVQMFVEVKQHLPQFLHVLLVGLQQHGLEVHRQTIPTEDGVETGPRSLILSAHARYCVCWTFVRHIKLYTAIRVGGWVDKWMTMDGLKTQELAMNN